MMLFRLEVSRCWTGEARALATKAGRKNVENFMLVLVWEEYGVDRLGPALIFGVL